MPVAIETHFIGPSNVRGSRYVATTANGHRLVLSADYALDADGNHDRVATALALKMHWFGKLARGGTKRGNAYVWCEEGWNTLDIPKPADNGGKP